MRYFLLIGWVIVGGCTYEQSMTGSELLDKAIDYHDPQDQWRHFTGVLDIEMIQPESPNRKSKVTIDRPKSIFNLAVESGEHRTTYRIHNDSCEITWNNKKTFTAEEKAKHRLTCDRGLLMRDYYTYLYGLPMKLKDPGTIVHDNVEQRIFEGKTYNVLKVTYQGSVGSDSWYFYFDRTTNAMEVYQFYHDEGKNDGEYIVLNKTLNYQNMRIPKNRRWYFNKDNTFIGEDRLMAVSPLD